MFQKSIKDITLNEEPILNNVPTYLCERKLCQYVLDNIDQYSGSKETNAPAAYGIADRTKANQRRAWQIQGNGIRGINPN